MSKRDEFWKGFFLAWGVTAGLIIIIYFLVLYFNGGL